MTGRETQESGDGALESVRRLEHTLEIKTRMQDIAETRLAAAREEATRLLAAAREAGARDAAERRRVVLAETDEVAARVLRQAWDGADRLRAVAKEDRAVAGRGAVEHILSTGVKVEEA